MAAAHLAQVLHGGREGGALHQGSGVVEAVDCEQLRGVGHAEAEAGEARLHKLDLGLTFGGLAWSLFNYLLLLLLGSTRAAGIHCCRLISVYLSQNLYFHLEWRNVLPNLFDLLMLFLTAPFHVPCLSAVIRNTRSLMLNYFIFTPHLHFFQANMFRVIVQPGLLFPVVPINVVPEVLAVLDATLAAVLQVLANSPQVVQDADILVADRALVEQIRAAKVVAAGSRVGGKLVLELHDQVTAVAVVAEYHGEYVLLFYGKIF